MGRYDGDSGLFTMADFKNRGVTKLAPDALVYISGNFGTSVILPVTGKTQNVDFQDGITTINIQNNVDPPGSSTASIEVVTPIYNEKSNYWINVQGDDGRTYRIPYFVPMMEIKIWLKGRFLVGGAPQYYPAFWGFIMNVEESYSGGMYKINLQCGDMLHWWSYVNVAYKPNPASNIMMMGKQKLSAYPSRYKRSNAFEIIYSLTQQMTYENFTPPDWLAKKTPQGVILPQAAVEHIFGGILNYWNRRFGQQENILRMYGAQGNLIPTELVKIFKRPFADNPQHPEGPSIDPAKGGSYSLVKEGYSIEDSAVKDFEVFMTFAEMGNLDTAEYFSKLEIATQVKSMVEYEFFQDVNGNFIFKPPFFNLNTKNILPYKIKAPDIINFSSTTNSDEIVTALQVETSIHQAIRNKDFVNNVGYHIDMDLTKRYGERFKKITVWWLSAGSTVARSAAVGHLSLMNVKAFCGNVTIPGRPEIRLGYPVYIDHKDVFYYVKSINHTFDYGGSFTTTLSLEGERPRVYDGKTFKIQKDKIYLLTEKFSADENDPISNQIEIDPSKSPISTNIVANQTSQQQVLPGPGKIQEGILRGSGYISSSQLGRYLIVDRKKPEQVRIGSDTIPYTDEEGYKVIGGFRYGRGIPLKAGTVLDGPTIEIALNTSAKTINQDRQNEAITNMKPAADEESNFMADFFKTEKTDGVETSIPSYLDFIGPMDPATAAQKMTNAVPKGETGQPSGPTTVLLSNAQDAGNLNKNVKTKTPGSGDGSVLIQTSAPLPGKTVYAPK